MSANNIVVIKKEEDGKLRGYHRDYDAYCEGQYDYGPCPFCNGGGENQICDACDACDGSGNYTPPEETFIFEVDTIEQAINAYNKWVQRMMDEDEFGFYVEYGYTFEGLEPNKETIETLEKSERGEDLHSFNTVDELFEDLEKRDISGKDEQRKIFDLPVILSDPEKLEQVCVGDWIAGIGDILSISEAKFIRRCAPLLKMLKFWREVTQKVSETLNFWRGAAQKVSETLNSKSNLDTKLLDFLQEQTNKSVYSGKVVCRNNTTGKGWRLHETYRSDGVSDVRQAITNFMQQENWRVGKPSLVVMYGIGQDDGNGGIGMWHGPTPNEKEMLAEDGKDDKSVIVRFNEDGTDDIIYRWTCGEWMRILKSRPV